MTTRVLVAARLSRTSGGPSRIERDDEAARAWAQANGRTVVATSEDPGVSGSVSPFKRKGLGPWLTDSFLLTEYDEIVASSVDRLGRNFRDMCTLRDWCEDTGKRITVLEPPLHWPPATDDMLTPIIWDLLARFAEWELQTITKRHGAARAKVRENRAFIGKPPFGFEVVGERYNRTIQPIPELADTIRELIRRALRGDTLLALAHWLDSQGVAPRMAGKQSQGTTISWSPTSVKNVLTSPALKGDHVNKAKQVLHRHQALITPEEWTTLQEAMNRGHKRSGRKRGENETAFLTGAIVCALCDGPMYMWRSTMPRKDGSRVTTTYYRCKGKDSAPSKCRNMVRADDIEGFIHAAFMDCADEVPELTPWAGMYAKLEVIEQVVVPGSTHEAEIAEVEDRLRMLDYDDPAFSKKQAQLLQERRRLQGLPNKPAEVLERPTGQRLCDVWETLDCAARRRYLLASELKIVCDPITREHRIYGNAEKIKLALRTLA